MSGILMINGKEATSSTNMASNIMYNTEEEYVNPNELKVISNNGDYTLIFGSWNGGGEPTVTAECERTFYNKANIFPSNGDYKSYLGFFKDVSNFVTGTFDAVQSAIMVGEFESCSIKMLEEGFEKTIVLPRKDKYIVIGSYVGYDYENTNAQIIEYENCECKNIGSCKYRDYQFNNAYFVKPKSGYITLKFHNNTSHAYIIGIDE